MRMFELLAIDANITCMFENMTCIFENLTGILENEFICHIFYIFLHDAFVKCDPYIWGYIE